MYKLQEQLGYRFQNSALLLEALTHVSFSMEQQQRTGQLHPNQQRLEFLGDAFLTYDIARRLFEACPTASEGELSRKRQQLVEGNWLDTIARNFDTLNDCVRMGVGERQKQATNNRWRKDTLEAILGAILLDGGDGAARAFVDRFIVVPDLQRLPTVAEKDPIVALGEFWQKTFKESMPEPVYYSWGQDHDLTWSCEVRTPDGMCHIGTDQNKKQAKREGCRKALAYLLAE